MHFKSGGMCGHKEIDHTPKMFAREENEPLVFKTVRIFLFAYVTSRKRREKIVIEFYRI